MSAADVFSLRLTCAQLYRFLALAIVTAFLAACQTTGSSRIHPEATFVGVEAKTDMSEIGALAVNLMPNKFYPTTFEVDGVRLSSAGTGFLWVPLYPGDYKLLYGISSDKMHSRDLRIEAGKTIYLNYGSWVWSEYEEVSREQFVGITSRNAIEPLETPVHMLLPKDKRTLVETCLAQKAEGDCRQALANIPAALIDDRVKAKMEAALTKPAPAQRPALAETPTPTPATEPTTAVSPTREPVRTHEAQLRASNLPPEIERDRLMVQITDLFKANNAVDALPLFERLNALPVPIDPTADFYWAQSLLANGDRVGASVKLTRFLETIDATSPFYAPSLRLMTKIEG